MNSNTQPPAHWILLFVTSAFLFLIFGTSLGMTVIHELDLSSTTTKLLGMSWRCIWILSSALLLARWIGLSAQALGFRRISLATISLSISLGLLCTVALNWLAPILRELLDGGRENPQIAELFDPNFSAAQILIMGLFITIVGPIVEEVFFRGTLLSAIERISTPTTAIIVSSIFFGIVHFDPINSFATGLLGVLCGWLRIRSGSIWSPILVHISFNGVPFLIYTLVS